MPTRDKSRICVLRGKRNTLAPETHGASLDDNLRYSDLSEVFFVLRSLELRLKLERPECDLLDRLACPKSWLADLRRESQQAWMLGRLTTEQALHNLVRH